MKIAAFMEEPEVMSGLSDKEEANLYWRMKQESGADVLIAVICGDFRQDGIWMQEKYDKRAGHLKKQGINLVVELPVYCTLNTFDTFAFSAVSTLEKLNCVDELLILCKGEDERIRKEITQFLFAEAQNEETEEINRHAVEYGKAVKRLYSTMKLRFISLEDSGEQRQTADKNSVDLFEERLWQELRKKLGVIDEQERKQYLNEISGGYAPMTEKILEAYEKNTDIEMLMNSLVTEKRSRGDLRRYFLRTLLGIRQVEISICGLYSYALYVNVVEEASEKWKRTCCGQRKDDLCELLKRKSWIPIIINGNSQLNGNSQTVKENFTGKYTGSLEQLDDSRKMLISIEEEAERLYRRLVTL